MNDGLSGIDETPRILPVFPLPNTVLFPGATVPLHIFEPRYRAMVRDASAGEGLIVISLMQGDGFLDLGTIGRIRDLEPLEDGRFNLRLTGLERVSLAEVPGDAAYRRVQVELRPEQTGTDDASVISKARLELLASYGILRSMFGESETLVLHQTLPFETAVNTICAGLPIDASQKLRLLGENSLIDRQRLVVEYISTFIETVSWLRALKDSGSTLTN